MKWNMREESSNNKTFRELEIGDSVYRCNNECENAIIHAGLIDRITKSDEDEEELRITTNNNYSWWDFKCFKTTDDFDKTNTCSEWHTGYYYIFATNKEDILNHEYYKESRE